MVVVNAMIGGRFLLHPVNLRNIKKTTRFTQLLSGNNRRLQFQSVIRSILQRVARNALGHLILAKTLVAVDSSLTERERTPGSVSATGTSVIRDCAKQMMVRTSLQ